MFRSQVVAVSVLPTRTAGEAAAISVAIAVDHRRSAVGAAIPAELVEVVGDHASQARADGPAAAAEADGVADASVAEASAEADSAGAVVSVAEGRSRRSE